MIKRLLTYLVIGGILFSLFRLDFREVSEWEIVPTTIDSPGLWNHIDFRNPDIPALIIPKEDHYQLESDWQVNKISYYFYNFGYGSSPEVIIEEITIQDGLYFKGEEKVDKEAVQGLLGAVDNLYPINTYIQGKRITDSYPEWRIEITGEDGRHLLMASSSVGNNGAGPWNIYDNGRLYGQFTGELGKFINELFTTTDWYSERMNQSDRPISAFATYGPLFQALGFWGLLPLSLDFTYHIDGKHGNLVGQFSSPVLPEEFGTPTGLSQAVIYSPEGTATYCEYHQIPTRNMFDTWEISCPVDISSTNGWYQFPIRVEFNTDKGQTFSTEGVLYGNWEWHLDEICCGSFQEYPPTLGLDFTSHPDVARLLNDHILCCLLYNGNVLSSGSPLNGTFDGEAIILGQVRVDERILKYSLGIPFYVEDSHLVRWDLSRSELEELISDFLDQPLTQRIIDEVPDVTLNLWYAEPFISPNEIVSPGYLHFSSYEFQIAPCENSPGEGKYPREDNPLRAFSFNNGYTDWFMEFLLLIDGTTIPAALDLWPLDNRRPELWPLLIPDELKTGSNLPFERIWGHRDLFFENNPPELILWIDLDQTSSQDIEIFNNITQALNIHIEDDYASGENLILTINPEGHIVLTTCNP